MNPSRNSTTAIMVVCAIIFVAFTFIYVFFYQSDLLLVEQHVLSKGQTQYHPLIGAVIITIALWLLQRLVNSVCRLTKSAYALTFLPSLLVLTIITGINEDIDKVAPFGKWVWIAPPIIIVFALAAWLLRKYQEIEPEPKSPVLFSKCMWVNLLTLFVMFFLVGISSNHDKTFHQRLRIERLLNENQPTEALSVGQKARYADACTTMLRVHALAQTNQLGQRLFEYPVVGGDSALTPNAKTCKPLLYPASKINLQKKKSATEYQLCQLLLSKDLQGFANLLTRKYPLDKPLPKHYKEALFLYTKLTKNPTVTMKDTVIEVDYSDFHKLRTDNTDKDVQQALAYDSYGKTYWYYYFYE